MSHGEVICPPLIAFGLGHSLSCYPLSKAFEAERYLESENGTDRRTDGSQHRFMAHLYCRGHNNIRALSAVYDIDCKMMIMSEIFNTYSKLHYSTSYRRAEVGASSS